MKTQKNKFEAFQAGITNHIGTGKTILYLDFYLDDVVYRIYEFLHMGNTFYARLNSLEMIIKYFGGVRNLRSLVKNLTADQVPEIEFKQKQYCDA